MTAHLALSTITLMHYLTRWQRSCVLNSLFFDYILLPSAVLICYEADNGTCIVAFLFKKLVRVNGKG